MLPFRTFESKLSNDFISVDIGKQNLIALRWNNPHSAECEINIWIKSKFDEYIVVPIKKPVCCGEGFQDNVISFTIPNDFTNLSSKIPGFNGCNVIGDCTLQIYAHSVEPRTPLIINGSKLEEGSFILSENNSLIQASTSDPLLNLDLLENEICLSTLDHLSNIESAIPRYARLVSDQFNHAYQNSDYSPYSGQQHESISRNLQSSIILRMTVTNGGELGKSLLKKIDKQYITNLLNNIDNVIEKYELTANKIFNKVKNLFRTTENLGVQKLADCFRCSNTGSVNSNRIEQRTYIPSFEIPNDTVAMDTRNKLDDEIKYLIPENTNTVQIYHGALKELYNKLLDANIRGYLYQPGMIKTNITTMYDVTNFLKVNIIDGTKDKGIYAATAASKLKIDNLRIITDKLPTIEPSTTSSVPTLTGSISTSPITNTLAPNPDDNIKYCGQTYENIDCNKQCNMGLDFECADTEICFLITTNICGFVVP